MNNLQLSVQKRVAVGTADARRQRRAGYVMGILYGEKKPPITWYCTERVWRSISEQPNFKTHMITLTIDGLSEIAMVKAVQKHAWKDITLHVDCLRVSQEHHMVFTVPIHFDHAEQCVGVKQQGGELMVHLRDIKISCLPMHLPEYLSVDVYALALHHVIHIADIMVPNHVTVIDEPSSAIVSVNLPHVFKDGI
jgi:large subunit ribosomal protein L25